MWWSLQRSKIKIVDIDEALAKLGSAKTNTLPKTNTYKHLPIVNTLLPWTVPHSVVVPGSWSDDFR